VEVEDEMYGKQIIAFEDEFFTSYWYGIAIPDISFMPNVFFYLHLSVHCVFIYLQVVY